MKKIILTALLLGLPAQAHAELRTADTEFYEWVAEKKQELQGLLDTGSRAEINELACQMSVDLVVKNDPTIAALEKRLQLEQAIQDGRDLEALKPLIEEVLQAQDRANIHSSANNMFLVACEMSKMR